MSTASNPKPLGAPLVELAEQYHRDLAELAHVDAALRAFDRLPEGAMFRLCLERGEAWDTSGLSFQPTKENPLGQWPAAMVGKPLARDAYEQRRTILKVRVDEADGKLRAAEHVAFSPYRAFKP